MLNELPATYDIWDLVKMLFETMWNGLFNVPFFMFPFSIGQLILASMFVSVAVVVLGRFIHNKGGGNNGNS